MSRQTSDRLVPISSAILVPLTTTVAWSLNRRTMRPRRWSVACDDFLRRLCCATRAAGVDLYLAMGNYPSTCGYSQQNSMVRETQGPSTRAEALGRDHRGSSAKTTADL